MAARPTPKKITFWSFSRYNEYRQCPLKAKFKMIDKLKEPGSPAMDRGNDIHQKAERYIKGELGRLPVELKQFEREIKEMRKLYKKRIRGAMVEDTWAFTRNWEITTWNDWVGCWVRIKLDAAHWVEDDVLEVNDWKTGKFKDAQNAEYIEQLELYALGALLMFPNLRAVRPKLRYTDEGLTFPRPDIDPHLEFTRADLPKLKKLWEKRIKPMLNDTKFPPRPGWYCRFCFFSSGHPTGPKLCKF